MHEQLRRRGAFQDGRRPTLPAIRPHYLRRARYADAACLGHAAIAITLDTCSHAIPALHEEAAALIAGLVFATDETGVTPRP